MRRTRLAFLVVLVIGQLILTVAATGSLLAQEWAVRGKQQGTIRVVDFFHPSVSEMLNYLESLVMLDKENKVVPCLGEDWRYVGDRTIEFKLRDDVRFQNGEKFNAEAVMVNWQEYRRMDSPGPNRFLILPDEMNLEIIDEYTVRFTFPTPDGLALMRILYFPQVAPAFFAKHQFAERNWGYFPEAGAWGTGPFCIGRRGGTLRQAE